MRRRLFQLSVIVLTAVLFAAACTAEATPPPVDTIGTLAAQLAYGMQTQTAAARSPTPPPATSTPLATETPTPEPTEERSGNVITVVTYTGCYHGPGPNYELQSMINVPKPVELLGIGSVEGWYVISGPYYYTACWVSATDVEVPEDVDLSKFPVMTPGR
jgi:hypothetical protein